MDDPQYKGKCYEYIRNILLTLTPEQLHFFYFEVGPCLAYLQELMVNIEEYSICFRNQTAESGDVTLDMNCDDAVVNSNDTSRVLDNATMTNTSMQVGGRLS
jgi:hypothetical protein